jgi:LPPG:FO 2-phospho-L-lactate transferase
MMNIVALAGGVGGAKLAHGLTLAPTLALPRQVGRGNLTIIVNTGDDFELYGLHISPDLDTVTYTLAGLANPDTGWGVAGDTFQFLDALKRLGVDAWFWLGDRDLATHIRRTDLLHQGKTLTEATQAITRSLNIVPTILPMTDDRFRTLLDTDQGLLEFQEYFVHRQWQPRIRSIRFDGASTAWPTSQVLAAIEQADAIIICPSNPFVSVDPILNLINLKGKRKPIVAVSPIIGGQAIKGPAAKMFAELGFEPSALNVAKHYRGLVTHFVLDQIDAAQENAIQSLGMHTLVTDTLMKSIDDRVRLANEVISFISNA